MLDPGCFRIRSGGRRRASGGSPSPKWSSSLRAGRADSALHDEEQAARVESRLKVQVRVRTSDGPDRTAGRAAGIGLAPEARDAPPS